MPIQAVETQRLYQHVANQLRDLIRQGEFHAGSRLSAERDLARQLGVSRPVVREAMIALEIAGLIEVRTGSGIYVRQAGNNAVQPAIMPDAGTSPFDVITVRKLLEPEIALTAAGSITFQNLDALAETLDEMRNAIVTGRDIKAADRLFHTRIVAATGNTVFVSIVHQLWGECLCSNLQRPELPRRTAGNQLAAVMVHTRTFKALQQHDGVAARHGMRAHLANVEAIMI